MTSHKNLGRSHDAWGLNVFAYLCFPFRYMRTHDTKSSLLQVAVGNVTALSEVTYEYGVKTKVKPSVETQPPTSEVVPVFPQGSSECSLTDSSKVKVGTPTNIPMVANAIRDVIITYFRSKFVVISPQLKRSLNWHACKDWDVTK